jgi:hypothetical protein
VDHGSARASKQVIAANDEEQGAEYDTGCVTGDVRVGSRAAIPQESRQEHASAPKETDGTENLVPH